MRWAQRLKRVFGIDVQTCAGCGGTMRIIASIEDPVVIKAILAHLAGKAYSPQPRLPPRRAPPAPVVSQSVSLNAASPTAFSPDVMGSMPGQGVGWADARARHGRGGKEARSMW